MSYRYEDLRPWVFTDEGQRALLRLRDWTMGALRRTGAFQLHCAIDAAGSGDSWQRIALVDRLVELGEIKLVERAGVASQYRVYVEAGR